MIIYPIAEQLERLMESIIDPETGELVEVWIDPSTGESYTLNEETLQTIIETMQMDFEEKIVNIRNEYINLTAEAEALKAEKAKLAKRQKRAEDSAERMKRWLAYLLKGEKFQKDTCKISYRESKEVVFDDEDPDKFIEWAEKNAPDLLKYTKPEPKKMDIKKAISMGEQIEFASLKTNKNIQVK